MAAPLSPDTVTLVPCLTPERKAGAALLVDPWTNRGLAFSEPERETLGLVGLLPAAVSSTELQVQRFMHHLRSISEPLQKYVQMMNLFVDDKELFVEVSLAHTAEIMPLVYTPVVGKACQEYSRLHVCRPGLYITLRDLGNVAAVLANWPETDVRAICFTDGQRILGLGDLGANGMGIPVGKLALYTICAGVHPRSTLPVTLDVGTDTESLLTDPLYIGVRQSRDKSAKYDALIDEFIHAAIARFGPTVLLQWEDFGNENAFRMLDRYQDKCCTFNDDIQGTASVVLAGLMASTRLTGKSLRDYVYLFNGAGMAGTGIADLIAHSITVECGVTMEEARRNIWLVDTKGLVVASRTDLQAHKLPYAHAAPHIGTFLECVSTLRPSVIVGVSAQPGSFSTEVLKLMAELHAQPLVFALSNPTSKSECTAEEAYTHTGGRAIFASGSPFDPVTVGDKTMVPGQANNSYIFPGLALAVTSVRCSRVPNALFATAARALADQVSEAQLASGCLFPPLSDIRNVSARIAAAVAEQAYDLGVATLPKPKNMLEFCVAEQYVPKRVGTLEARL